MTCELVTPDGTAYNGEILSVSVPTGMGEITILPHHRSLIATVEPGSVIIRTAEQELVFAVSRGALQVNGGSVRILADTADSAEGLDEEAAIDAARKRAEELAKEKRTDSEGFADATAMLERELGRLRTVRRLRSRRRSSRQP